MRTISKGAEPCCLTAWKRKNTHGAYDDLDKTEEGKVCQHPRCHIVNPIIMKLPQNTCPNYVSSEFENDWVDMKIRPPGYRTVLNIWQK